MNRRLLANVIRTPDGTILQSFHTHDYKTYTDKNGFEYMVDGGISYLRRNVVEQAPAEDLSVYYGDSHEIVRERMHWGTRGKDGKLPLKWVPLKELKDDHIQAILETQNQISPELRQTFIDEQTFRNTV